MSDNKHAVWIVSRDWIGEARESRRTLGGVMPDVQTWLYSNGDGFGFDKAVEWYPRARWYETMVSGLISMLNRTPSDFSTPSPSRKPMPKRSDSPSLSGSATSYSPRTVPRKPL